MPDTIPNKPAPAPFTPSMPKEMPLELKGQTFKMDDTLTQSGHDVVTIEDKRGNEIKAPVVVDTSKAGEKPIVEEKKTPIAKEDKPKKEEEITIVEEDKTKVEDKPKEEKKTELPSFLKAPKDAKVEDKSKGIVPAIDTNKVVRDYTGYTPDEVNHLKQMSDSAYKYTVDLIKRNKENESKASGLYLQDPEAYTLSPEYKQLQNTNVQAKRELELYTYLLGEVKAGNEIPLPEDYDPKTGKFIFSKGKVKPTDSLEEDLRKTVYNLDRVMRESDGKLNEVQTGFKNKVQQDIANIHAVREQHFDWVKNPELLKYSIPCGELGDKTLQQIKDDFKGLFPAYMQSHPAVEVVGDLMIALRWSNALLAEAQSGQKVAETIKEEAIRGEPKSSAKPSSNGKKSEVFTYDIQS